MLLKHKKLWSTLAIVLLVISSISATVQASSSIDFDKLGSITINTRSSASASEISYAGIKFTLYKVAELSSTGSYFLTSDFLNSGVQLEALTRASEIAAVSKTLADYAGSKNILGSLAVTEDNGTASWEGLTLGCYLVVQMNSLDNSKHFICNPFLIAIPMKSEDGSRWIYHVTANPKIEPIVPVTEAPTQPAPPTQTAVPTQIAAPTQDVKPNQNNVSSPAAPTQVAAPTQPNNKTQPKEPTQPVVPVQAMLPMGLPFPMDQKENLKPKKKGKDVQPIFILPKTGGSICSAVCTYGGILMMISGTFVFIISRKK